MMEAKDIVYVVLFVVLGLMLFLNYSLDGGQIEEIDNLESKCELLEAKIDYNTFIDNTNADVNNYNSELFERRLDYLESFVR